MQSSRWRSMENVCLHSMVDQCLVFLETFLFPPFLSWWRQKPNKWARQRTLKPSIFKPPQSCSEAILEEEAICYSNWKGLGVEAFEPEKAFYMPKYKPEYKQEIKAFPVLPEAAICGVVVVLGRLEKCKVLSLRSQKEAYSWLMCDLP